MQRRQLTTPGLAPSTPPLIAPIGNGTGSTPPSSEEPQGLSPVDYELELEADFPPEMVLEMQEGAVRKAQRMVIGRALGGRPTIKALQDCLKLHLPTSYTSVTILTRGFFEVLFTNEKGAKFARKIATVEWSGLHLSFSRYIPNFDTSVQGAETLLSHTIKVQFPNLHEQFRNTKALTIMTNKIREVLEIEPEDSYIKRPAGPMIIVETHDINKLAGYIRIPSMAEGATAKDTTLQRILYSGLPNQCRKCRRFGHFARTCTITKIPIWNRNAPASTPQTWSERVARGLIDTSATQSTTHSHKNESRQGNWSKQSTRESGPPSQTEGAQTRQNAPTKIRKNEGMGELLASLPHQIECNLNVNPSKVTTLVEGTDGSNTSKAKLSFNLSGEKNDSAQGKWANLNPFEVLNGENEHSDFLRKILEELEGGWTFQGKKK
jgi:hypothetical protein